MALVGITATKQYLGIASTNTDYDDMLNIIIPRASNLVENALHRTVTATTYTEYFDIHTTTIDRITVDNPPIITVAAMTDCSALVESSKYVVKEEPGSIVLMCGYYFTEGIKMVEVTYYAGEETGDEDLDGIKGIIYGVIDGFVSRRGLEGLKSMRLGDLSISLSPGSLEGILSSFSGELQLYMGRIT